MRMKMTFFLCPTCTDFISWSSIRKSFRNMFRALNLGDYSRNIFIPHFRQNPKIPPLWPLPESPDKISHIPYVENDWTAIWRQLSKIEINDYSGLVRWLHIIADGDVIYNRRRWDGFCIIVMHSPPPPFDHERRKCITWHIQSFFIPSVMAEF